MSKLIFTCLFEVTALEAKRHAEQKGDKTNLPLNFTTLRNIFQRYHINRIEHSQKLATIVAVAYLVVDGYLLTTSRCFSRGT